MSVLGASRFTAVLAAVTIAGMAGTFWWALKTRSEMQNVTASYGSYRTPQPKFSGRTSRSREERSPRFSANRFELMGKSERFRSTFQPEQPQAGSSGQNQNQGTERSIPAPLLTNYPNTVMAAPGGSLQNQGSSVIPPNSSADMPLPALPVVRPDPDPLASWQAKAASPTLLPLQAPAPPAAAPEIPKRQAREARSSATAAGRSAKRPGVSYYIEKYIDHGEYRYRRRTCEPPNMPDVCFMPQAERQPVLVAKP